MEFSLEMLTKSLADYEQASAGPVDTSNAVFLPDGIHKGRFIIDKSGKEFFTMFNTYGFFNAGIRDPKECDDVPEDFVNVLQPLYWDYLRHAQKWSRNRSTTVLCYFYLVDTNKPSEKWQPGNLYCIIGKKKFGDAITAFFSNIVKDAPELAIPMLNPDLETDMVSLSVTSGRDGGISISVAYPPKKASAVDLSTANYTDLQHAYIAPGFDKEKYNRLVVKYLNEIQENADYILAKKWEEEETAKSKKAAEEGVPFVASPKPEQLIIEVNGQVLTPEMFGGKSEEKKVEATEAPSEQPATQSTQPEQVNTQPAEPVANVQPAATQTQQSQPTQQNPVDVFAAFAVKKPEGQQ